ncbi:MAG: hypothetical protein CVU90_03600 [Firmicutes bacterium HGW-Firmicutes-15]|nr:MAG: hypothetical protein CVU90_03600 [Firmicutes bacterium HGW-Firmicutes-15]
MSEVLIYILLTLGVLLGIILLAPIHLDILGEYAESLSFQGRVRWAWGLFSFEVIRSEGRFHWSLGFLGLKKAKPKSIRKTPGRKKLRTEKKPGGSSGNISSFINLQLFTALKVVFRKLVRALHLELNLTGTYGFEDPSLTGVTVGVIAALNRGSSSIDLNPDFTRALVDIRGSVRGWFIPFQILTICVVFSLKKPVRAIWWPKIKYRKKQKEAVQYA